MLTKAEVLPRPLSKWIYLGSGISLAAIVVNVWAELLAIPLAIAVFGYFWKHRENFVLFLLVYTPFEEVILKFLPDSLYVPLRYGWEAMLLAIALLLLFERGIVFRDWKHSVVDKPVIIFAFAWFVSGFINDTPAVTSLFHIKNLLRYVAIFYVIYNLPVRTRFLRRVLACLIAVGLIEAFICFGQAIEGTYLVELFRPKEVMVGGELVRGTDIQLGSYYTRFTGSFARSNDLGNYLTFVLCFLTSIYLKRHRVRWVLCMLPVISALILTSSRISWISAFVAVGTILVVMRHRLRWAYFLVPLAGLGIILAAGIAVDDDSLMEDFNALDRFYYIFTSDYFETMADTGRLYALIRAAPAVLAESPFLGLGPGTFMTISDQAADEESFGDASQLGLEPAAVNYVHDIGYVAMVVQVGLVGLTAFTWVLFAIYRTTKKAYRIISEPLVKSFMLGSIGLLVAVAIQNLASFNLMYRNQSLVIWTVCGLAAALGAFHKRANGTMISEEMSP